MSARALGAAACLAVLAAGCAAPQRRSIRSESVLANLTALSPGEGGTLDARALQGRVALVTFMATWCAPCLMELPYFARLYEQHQSRGFLVVAVGMDLEGALVLQPFAREYALPFPLVVPDDRIRTGTSPFGPISTLPTTFLLGRDGEVLAAFQGMASQPALSVAVERALSATDARL